jgi:hypothetical protein
LRGSFEPDVRNPRLRQRNEKMDAQSMRRMGHPPLNGLHGMNRYIHEQF